MKIRWRAWARRLHRDLGFAFVGLTLVYAISGLAVNHIADWDANFSHSEETRPLPATVVRDSSGRATPDAQAIAQIVAEEWQLGPMRDLFADGDEVELQFDGTRVVIDTHTASARIESRRPRWLIRSANWLHLNRGKRSWTIIADAYAIALLLLSATSVFMLPSRSENRRRSLIFLTLGLAVPVLYVVLSGGPQPGG